MRAGTAPDGAATALAAIAWPDVGRPLLFVPLGSVEQHGPHLPLATDTVIATAVAQRLAERAHEDGERVLVAPPVAYGASGEHEGFPGTISLGTSALSFVLRELARSASAWTARIVLVNGHGGNTDALVDAVPALRAEGRDVSWLPCAVPGGKDAHAGFDETSLLLHLRPRDVRLDRAQPGATAPLGDLLTRLRAEGVSGVSPNGVLGDPTGASARAGARLFQSLCDSAWARLRRGPIDAQGRLTLPTADSQP